MRSDCEKVPQVVTQLPDAAWRQRFRRSALAWYRRSARNLPWRKTRDPYSIWVSEVMLQQTRVATVEAYYRRFLATFPDIESLAAADEQRVLRLWEGLGYYRRARQLHKAARVIVRDYGGRFPKDPATVRSLPGIGRYTAGAILSIAFDLREPALDGNAVRVLSRLLAYTGDVTRSDGQRLLWTFAESLLPRRNVGELNQALMELGSEICLPRAPRCHECPVAPLCSARLQGREDSIPRNGKPVRYEDVRETAVVVRRAGRVLLRRCQADERWSGLWDFPRFAVDSNQRGSSKREMVDQVRRRTGLTVKIGDRLTTIKHGVTRFRITLECYEASLPSVSRQKPAGESRWVRLADLKTYPLSVTGRKICRLLLVQR
jgi:A/G-specific adenine glycosylase